MCTSQLPPKPTLLPRAGNYVARSKSTTSCLVWQRSCSSSSSFRRCRSMFVPTDACWDFRKSRGLPGQTSCVCMMLAMVALSTEPHATGRPGEEPPILDVGQTQRVPLGFRNNRGGGTLTSFSLPWSERLPMRSTMCHYAAYGGNVGMLHGLREQEFRLSINNVCISP